MSQQGLLSPVTAIFDPNSLDKISPETSSSDESPDKTIKRSPSDPESETNVQKDTASSSKGRAINKDPRFADQIVSMLDPTSARNLLRTLIRDPSAKNSVLASLTNYGRLAGETLIVTLKRDIRRTRFQIEDDAIELCKTSSTIFGTAMAPFLKRITPLRASGQFGLAWEALLVIADGSKYDFQNGRVKFEGGEEANDELHRKIDFAMLKVCLEQEINTPGRMGGWLGRLVVVKNEKEGEGKSNLRYKHTIGLLEWVDGGKKGEFVDDWYGLLLKRSVKWKVPEA
ncbi:MAG: hypothetical protein MMC33_005901 [Icmadophila ericetorum]|nr:hypothetical protein [Icmadophila ericetorum]